MKLSNSGFFFSYALLGACIALGTFKIAKTLSQKTDRYVVVKGFVEKEVLADYADWRLQVDLYAYSLSGISQQRENAVKKMQQFLQNQGFLETEISLEESNVYPTYGNDKFPFRGAVVMAVRTSQVQIVERASKGLTALQEEGILVNDNRWNKRFFFTKVKEIKSELLQGAVEHAQKSAEDFAGYAGAKVGKIRKADQGIIQIMPIDRSAENNEFFIKKIVRVVSTIDFYLED